MVLNLNAVTGKLDDKRGKVRWLKKVTQLPCETECER